MHLKTILNCIEKHASFVYENERLITDDGPCRIEIEIRPRANGLIICSGCGKPASGYDQLKPRSFQYVPLWNVAVFFIYTMRRVECPRCGVKVEAVPFADTKSPVTRMFAWFLANWAQRLSWSEVGRIFGASWRTVRNAVSSAVAWGREHLELSGIKAIGVDELQCRRGSKMPGAGATFATLVYQIDESKRLLWVGHDRNEKSFADFFQWFGTEATSKLQFVCSDMWRPYLKVIRDHLGHTVHVLDRFHIMKNFNKAIDQVRAKEVKELARRGLKGVLTNMRWILLKNQDNLTTEQATKLADLLRLNLRVVRAYLLREEFQKFWTYSSPFWAGKFLDSWCQRANRSRIEPMKAVAKTLQRHRHLLLNWFSAKHLSSGAVEGLNNKANVTIRKSYGFRTFSTYQLALYHALGDLPQPKFTHRFW